MRHVHSWCARTCASERSMCWHRQWNFRPWTISCVTLAPNRQRNTLHLKGKKHKGGKHSDRREAQQVCKSKDLSTPTTSTGYTTNLVAKWLVANGYRATALSQSLAARFFSRATEAAKLWTNHMCRNRSSAYLTEQWQCELYASRHEFCVVTNISHM